MLISLWYGDFLQVEVGKLDRLEILEDPRLFLLFYISCLCFGAYEQEKLCKYQ